MSHIYKILMAMQNYKCTVCGSAIGDADAGSRVHLVCMEQEAEEAVDNETSA